MFTDDIEQKETLKTCPHLGLKDDPLTSIAYPSSGNYCHYVNPIAIPILEHQRSTCLTSLYVDCLILKKEEGQKMVNELRFKKPFLPHLPKPILMGSVATILVILAFLSFAYGRLGLKSTNKNDSQTHHQAASETSVNTPAKEVINDVSIIDNEQPQITFTPVAPAPTLTQIQPTPTAERPPLSLGVPIGGEIKFILHRVIEGETLLHFAERYRTTVEAIKAINYELLDILWIDWVIVIPIEVTDVSNLPQFEPYEVPDDKISVSNLAEKLGTSLELLSRYNNIPENMILYAGDWVIIPREQPEY